MRKLDAAEISRTGMYGVWCGQATNKWSLTDKDTGEVIEGVKLAWFGGTGSARFSNPADLELFIEGDLIEVEVPLNESKGSYKPGKGRLVSVNGTPINKKTKAA